MHLGRVIFALAFVTAAFADTLTLRSGHVVTGTYLGGTARTVKMEIGGVSRTYDVTDVASLQFTAPAAATAPTGQADTRPGRATQTPAKTRQTSLAHGPVHI